MADLEGTVSAKRRALEQVIHLSTPPAHLDATARRLRAVILEIAHRIAENDEHHRLPNLGTLVQEAAQLSARLGYTKPPLQVFSCGDRRLDPATVAANRQYWVLELHHHEPGFPSRGLIQIEAWYGGAKRPVVVENLRLHPEYIKPVVDVLFRWVRHLDLPPAEVVAPSGKRGTPRAEFQDGTSVTTVEIAKRLELPHDPVRKRLDRWRKKHFEGYREQADAPNGEAKYFYDVSAIRPVLNKLVEKAARLQNDRRATAARPRTGAGRT